MNQYGFNYGQVTGLPSHQRSNENLHDHHGQMNPQQLSYGQSFQHDASLAQESFDRNRSLIPGLGFGYQPSQPSTWPEHSAQTRIQNGAEDPDLSEGEFEDLYEPSLEPAGGRRQASTTASHKVGAAGTGPGSSDEDAERNGSYSPRLSPDDFEQHPSKPSEALTGQAKTNTVSLSSVDPVAEGREQARQAISHLLPYKIGYSQFIEHGIDQSLVQSLFKELGIPGVPELQPQSVTQAEAPLVSASPKAQPAPSQPAKPVDKSEERKDRIARLLAAKKPRQQQSPIASTKPSKAAESAIPTMDSSSSTSAGLNASKSEAASAAPKAQVKSLGNTKLLQMKMEALRKAREAKAESLKATPQLTPTQPATQGFTTGPITQKPAVSAMFSSGSGTATPLPAATSQPHSSKSDSLEQSSSPVPKAHSLQRKRPVAADLNSHVEMPVKKPFNQTHANQPFLIDVSDEEDSDGDTAMDLDSPEQRPVSLRRQSTHGSSVRQQPPYSSNGMATPVAAISRVASSAGKDGLDKMNKDIEEMKRLIAEAEARKKVQQSRSTTPLQAPSAPRSEVSVGTAGDASQLEDLIQQASNASPSTVVRPFTQRTLTDPALKGGVTESRGRSASGSMSRSANERLAVIEADRKRQQLRMRILHAQIAQMEKEMAASLLEESELRKQATPVAEDMEEDVDVTPASSAHDAASNREPKLDEREPLSSPSSPHRDESSEPAESAARLQPNDVLVTDGAGAALETKSPTRSQQSPVQMEESAQSEEMSDVDDDADAVMEDVTSEGSEESDDHSSDDDESSNDVAEDVRDNSSRSVSDALSGSGASEVSDVEASVLTEELPVTSDLQPAPETIVAPPTAAISSAVTDAPKTQSYQRIDAVDTDQDTNSANDTSAAVAPGSGLNFQPYESPLQYFHAFRFHPDFDKLVKGGLRSLTYSNKIDVRLPICPDELLGQSCPRGSDCDFQHLGQAGAPDDHILMQLGSYGAHEGEKQDQFNRGLRKLLTDFRDRKVRDFGEISRAIIDYRAQFHGDRSKILPLGNVSL